MKIETKYNVGDILYFIEDDKVKKGSARGVKIDLDAARSNNPSISYYFGKSLLDFHTIPEHRVSDNIDDLLEHLKSNVKDL